MGLAEPKMPLLSEPDSEEAVVEGVGGTERAARLSLRRSRGAGAWRGPGWYSASFVE